MDAAKLALWHERQGFEATYVTDHNIVYDGSLPPPPGTTVNLLPGVEWSPIASMSWRSGPSKHWRATALAGARRGWCASSTPSSARGAQHRFPPGYWRNHQDELNAFVLAGVDGFEIVNCSPKALGFPSDLRRQVIALARIHDLMVVGASDNHGWGQVTCVWNVSQPGAQGFQTNRVFARPLALVQGEWRAWTAPATQPWFLLRSLSWSERVSWLTWVLIILLYRALPRREGQSAGLGILARSLGRRRKEAPPNQTPT